MTTNRTVWSLLLSALMMAPLACAQHGPTPGYDPVSYAQAYYGAQAANATADPAGYAQRQASTQALANQTTTALYIACWEAYEQTGMLTDPVCAAYFEAPEKAARRHAMENSSADDAKAALNETLANAGQLANTTLDAVNDTVADPASAPSQLQRIVDAVAGFANATVTLIVDTVKRAIGGTVDTVVGLVNGILDGLGLGMKGAGIGLAALSDALTAAFGGLATASSATASGIGSLFGAIANGAVATVRGLVDAIGSAASATASGLGSAASAAANGIASAGRAVADGAASATQAVGNAISSAIDAVTGLFSSHASKGGAAGGAGQGVSKALPTGDLLGKVRQAVPL